MFLALIVGILLGLVQISVDYHNVRGETDKRARQILEIVAKPVTEAVYTLKGRKCSARNGYATSRVNISLTTRRHYSPSSDRRGASTYWRGPAL